MECTHEVVNTPTLVHNLSLTTAEVGWLKTVLTNPIQYADTETREHALIRQELIELLAAQPEEVPPSVKEE